MPTTGYSGICGWIRLCLAANMVKLTSMDPCSSEGGKLLSTKPNYEIICYRIMFVGGFGTKNYCFHYTYTYFWHSHP